MPFAKVSKKGQVTLPKEIREKYNIVAGGYVRFIQLEDGVKLLPTNQKGISAIKGVVKVRGKQDFGAIRGQVMEKRYRQNN